MTKAYSYNRYGDNLARKQRRRFFIIFLTIVMSALSLGTGLFYLFFVSQAFKITALEVSGTEVLETDSIISRINSMANENIWPILSVRPQNNILFFDRERTEQRLLDEFPILKKIEIKKEFFHKLIVTIAERKAIGTWCFKSTCHYFDEDGILWGQALKSSGSLLLIIEDFRNTGIDSGKLDIGFLNAIRQSIDGAGNLGMKIKKIEIPENSITDFRIYTVAGYYLLLDSGADIKNQLTVLEIFLKDKGKDFNSEYIDLRIEGRAYYK